MPGAAETRNRLPAAPYTSHMALLQDIRYAARLLVKDPWFALVAAVALGLGIGLNTTVFTFVNAVLIRGLPFDHSEEIYFVEGYNTRTGNDTGTSYPDFLDYREQSRAFAGLALWRGTQINLSDPGRPPERYSGAQITPNTFGLLRQPVLLGRDFSLADSAPGASPVAIIGGGLWKTRYGRDPNILGTTIRLNDKPATIVGVMPDGMRFPTGADLWQPLVADTAADADTGRRDTRAFAMFGRLAPDTSSRTATTELNGIASRLQQQYVDTNKEISARLLTFNERFNGGPIRLVFLALMGAVGCVLLIACANVANLLLARSTRRTREVAIRFALGASRARVVGQLLVESVLLACLGGALGLALAVVGARLFDAAVADVGKPYWITFTMDWRVFGFMAVVCLATGILFGLAPALQVSRTNVNEVLKDGSRGTSGGVRSRRMASVMVVAEIAMTLVLLTGAGLMIRSFLALYTLDVGIETSHLLTMRTRLSDERYKTPEQQQQFFDAALLRLSTLPGVVAAGSTSSLPLNGGMSQLLEIEGKPIPQDNDPRATALYASEGYFDAVDLPLRQGRRFGPRDGLAGSETVVVDQRFVEVFLPGEDPLGRRLRRRIEKDDKDANPWRTIVGVVGSVQQANPQDTTRNGVLYMPARQQPSLFANLVVRAAGDPGQLTTSVRQAITEIDPEQPLFDVRTMDQSLAQSRWPYRVFGSMFAIFALIALVLATVGIYAVTAYSVSQRQAEIGVRLALGAQPRQVSWLVLRGALRQLAVGLGLGLLGGWGVTFVLKSLVVSISATDPVTFVAISILICLVTIAACAIPARRATRLDPVTALRD
jgi:putative ABC transport system permease protein